MHIVSKILMSMKISKLLQVKIWEDYKNYIHWTKNDFDAIPDELVQEEKILNTATILIEWSLRSEQ